MLIRPGRKATAPGKSDLLIQLATCRRIDVPGQGADLCEHLQPGDFWRALLGARARPLQARPNLA